MGEVVYTPSTNPSKVQTPFPEIKIKFPKKFICQNTSGTGVFYTVPSDKIFILSNCFINWLGLNVGNVFGYIQVNTSVPEMQTISAAWINCNVGNKGEVNSPFPQIIFPANSTFSVDYAGLNCSYFVGINGFLADKNAESLFYQS